MVRGTHTLNFGGEAQRVDADFDLRVFQKGRIEMIEDFPDFDRNGDARSMTMICYSRSPYAAVSPQSPADSETLIALILRASCKTTGVFVLSSR